ncbi:MAG: phasin family protein [Candidatus Parabeggiatoa sp. nov. 1]|nr:MAG: phasin family protein [Gammaproteobacteria bacterium]
MTQNELMKQWTESNKSAMDAIKELGEINTNAMSRLTQRQQEMVNLYMEEGTKQLEVLDEVKGVQDIVAAQSRLFTELNEKLMANARQTMDDLVEVKDKLSTWTEKGMENANAAFSQTAENK